MSLAPSFSRKPSAVDKLLDSARGPDFSESKRVKFLETLRTLPSSSRSNAKWTDLLQLALELECPADETTKISWILALDNCVLIDHPGFTAQSTPETLIKIISVPLDTVSILSRHIKFKMKLLTMLGEKDPHFCALFSNFVREVPAQHDCELLDELESYVEAFSSVENPSFALASAVLLVTHTKLVGLLSAPEYSTEWLIAHHDSVCRYLEILIKVFPISRTEEVKNLVSVLCHFVYFDLPDFNPSSFSLVPPNTTSPVFPLPPTAKVVQSGVPKRPVRSRGPRYHGGRAYDRSNDDGDDDFESVTIPPKKEQLSVRNRIKLKTLDLLVCICRRTKSVPLFPVWSLLFPCQTDSCQMLLGVAGDPSSAQIRYEALCVLNDFFLLVNDQLIAACDQSDAPFEYAKPPTSSSGIVTPTGNKAVDLIDDTEFGGAGDGFHGSDLEPAMTHAFTSYSQSLAQMLYKIHNFLTACLSTKHTYEIVRQLLICVRTLVVRTPYHQLRRGLLTKMIRVIKPLTRTRESSVVVCAFSVIRTILVSVRPSLEVLTDLGLSASLSSSQLSTPALSGTQSPMSGVSSRGSGASQGQTPWMLTLADKLVNPSKPNIHQMLVIESIRLIQFSFGQYFMIWRDHFAGLLKFFYEACKHHDPYVIWHVVKTLHDFGLNIIKLTNDRAIGVCSYTSSNIAREDLWLESETACSGSTFIIADTASATLRLQEDMTSFWLDMLSNRLIGFIQRPIAPEDTGTSMFHDLATLTDYSHLYLGLDVTHRRPPKPANFPWIALKCASISCLRAIGEHVFSRLPSNLQILVMSLTLADATSSYSTTHVSCRISGIRAAACLLCYPSLQSDAGFVCDVVEAILAATAETPESLGQPTTDVFTRANPNQCMQLVQNAFWALSIVSDVFESSDLVREHLDEAGLTSKCLDVTSQNVVVSATRNQPHAIRSIANFLCRTKQYAAGGSFDPAHLECFTLPGVKFPPPMKIQTNLVTALVKILKHDHLRRKFEPQLRDIVLYTSRILTCDSFYKPRLVVSRNLFEARTPSGKGLMLSFSLTEPNMLDIWSNLVQGLEMLIDKGTSPGTRQSLVSVSNLVEESNSERRAHWPSASLAKLKAQLVLSLISSSLTFLTIIPRHSASKYTELEPVLKRLKLVWISYRETMTQDHFTQRILNTISHLGSFSKIAIVSELLDFLSELQSKRATFTVQPPSDFVLSGFKQVYD